MVAPDAPGNPARNHLFGTIRLFFHTSHGHALPSPPRTMAPQAGFQLLSHEPLALARAHTTSQATGVSLAISTQVGIQTSTRTARQNEDYGNKKGIGKNTIHEANTITDTRTTSQLPLHCLRDLKARAFPFILAKRIPRPSRSLPVIARRAFFLSCHCEKGQSPEAAIQRNLGASHRTGNTPKTFTAPNRDNFNRFVKFAYPRGAKVSQSESSDLASIRV